MLFSYYNMLLIISLIWDSFSEEISWDYQNFYGWGDISTTCNLGENQSPVDLRCYFIVQNRCKKALRFFNYNEGAQESIIKNNGHTVELSGTWGEKKPSITGALYRREVYTFSNAHLHWSTADNNGTEHAIEGQKYATELHLVHLNQKYRNLCEALRYPDGIAVIGIVYRVDDNVPPNPGMVQFATLAREVLSINTTARVTSLNLNSFIPYPLPPVYSYIGSLTTPPCTESVRWTVLSEPQPITSAIMTILRNIILSHDDTSNVRPLQPINNRLIKFYLH